VEASFGGAMRRLLWLPLGIVLLTACARPTIYAWGEYEDLIYRAYAKPGSVSPEQQVEALERDYQKARAENKRVPPGWHAHLGVLYFQLGKLDQAIRELETEKAEFPESAVLVDRLMANVRKR
jgi:hypothetical protein